MSSVRFLCQHCHQPLQLSPRVETQGLPEASVPAPLQGDPGDSREDSAFSRTEADSDKLQDSASTRPHPADGGASKDRANHFTLVGEIGSMQSLGSIQEAVGDIFDILSDQKVVDHPLCVECTDSLLGQLDTELALTEVDLQNYQRCLETAGERTRGDDRDALQRELRALELEEARLAQELDAVDRAHAGAAADLEAAQAETAELERQERQHLGDCCALEWQGLELLDQLGSLENQLERARAQLHLLKETDVFRATFEIREEGAFGIINNFRLGCLPAVPVAWNEISAAWGQTALLLQALATKIGLEFQRYRLFPCGSRSYLKSLAGDDPDLPLFCTGGRNSSSDDKFDDAMVAFLDCMQQFAEEAGKGSQGLCLPYRIRADRGLLEDLGGSREHYSIRTLSNTKKQWTKALKFMLVNFKWSITWVSLRYSQK
ncbi:beclin-2 [Otolemur garnettii]|nr:beclin-2 [Otolemur garnettii]